ncbi:MAG: glycosyl hydrolase family 65 protein [Solirubrobacteraceae bacterium]
MRWSRFGVVAWATLALPVLAASAASAASAATGAYVLEARSPGGHYAPTFTGNGFLGVRVPATGQGYAGGSVPAQSELAGFYAKPTKPKKISDAVQQRANIPTWSTLLFGDGTQVFSTKQGQTTGWRQSIDLHTGVVTTSATWKASDGHAAKLVYRVLTNRADAHVGLVQLQFTPQWTGSATVTDEIDGSPATLTDPVTNGFNAAQRQDYVAVMTQGTGIEAAIASQLATSPNVNATPIEVDDANQSIGQQLSFPVVAGQSYTVTKYVGVEDSQDTATPVVAAQADAARAAAAGWAANLAANGTAWAKLWSGRVDVLGDQTLATDVNASEFYLWSSTRDGLDWSVSPAGLSSNGYDGHIFWDAETWMYPSLLAQHPTLAGAMEAYRFQRLAAAEQHPTATGSPGARFPWESALDGTEQIPPPVSVNSEGLYEQHITADVALAQWQYYLATGDRGWLGSDGWPVLSAAASFWASRAVRGPAGRYHIDHVTGPDEENPDVNDEVFTNVAAKTTLEDAVKAARVLGIAPPAGWSRVAAGLVVALDAARGIHPEFAGYGGQLVKQADVTLLQYPWAYPMSRRIAQSDLGYYVPRTDPMGPSMSDAVNSIDSSTLGTPGCSSFVYTERSYQPFIRDVFHQFSETSTGGAFTFMTGIGGFLQEFLYGYSGMRLGAGSVALAPSLTSQLGGVVLHDVAWHGRLFTVTIKPRATTVTLLRGGPLPISGAAGRRLVRAGHNLTLPTARPDLIRSADRVRCAAVRASSSVAGAPALAAVDGSSATDWQPASLPASLTATVPGATPVRRVLVTWGRQWPPAPKPNVHPPAHPVIVRRATRYSLLVSIDGRRWRRLITVLGKAGTTETLTFSRQRVKYVRLQITSATDHQPPLLEELQVTG